MAHITNGAIAVDLPTPRVPAVRNRLRDAPVTGAKKVLLAAPRGYCAGVDRAVVAVEKALEHYGSPVYVRKQIVHNVHVVSTLESQGAIFVDEVEEVPEGSHVVFSAHGVSPAVVKGAADRTTLVQNPAEVDDLVIDDPDNLVWLSQTTLSVDETMETVRRLRERFPTIQNPPSDDICYATQNRQVAIKKVSVEADLVIVVGSANSSNSVRLVEVALEHGAKAAYRVDYSSEIRQERLDGVETVGVTSGASVPEVLVKEVLDDLADAGYLDVSEVVTAHEDLMFSLPKELRTDSTGAVDSRALGGRTR